MRILSLPAILLFWHVPLSFAFADLTSPTTDWHVVSYPGSNQFDYFQDQQTGNSDADIVGDGNHPGFYMSFDNAGTPQLNDGFLSMRVRIGSDHPRSGTFDNNLFVGVDADHDGALDLFYGINNQGNNSLLAIWDPGTDANTSPDTTSIVSPAVYSTAQTTTNYEFVPVDATNDPTASSFDIDADGDNDYFLSFTIDFAAIVSQMSLVAGISIDERTALNFVLATANNDNSLNQDLNGANGGIGSTLTWSQLGVLSDPFSVSQFSIPEPGPAIACVVMLALLALIFRRFPRRNTPPVGHMSV